MRNGWVWGRAPATIANVGPGFDVFALAIHGPRDEVAIRPAEEDSLAVEGVDAEGIPTKFSENTAGIVIDALRAATGISQPLRVRVRKGVPSSRGLGSSAASCAGAALAYLKAFPSSSSLGAEGFIQAAVAGEAAVSGRHYDNVAAALLGIDGVRPCSESGNRGSGRERDVWSLRGARNPRHAARHNGRQFRAAGRGRGEGRSAILHRRGLTSVTALPRRSFAHGRGAWLCSMSRIIWSN